MTTVRFDHANSDGDHIDGGLEWSLRQAGSLLHGMFAKFIDTLYAARGIIII